MTEIQHMKVKTEMNAIKNLNAKVAAVVAAGTTAVLAAGPAMAEAVDVATAVTDIKSQIASIALVGGAVLGVYAAVKAFKWIRSAMS